VPLFDALKEQPFGKNVGQKNIKDQIPDQVIKEEYRQHTPAVTAQNSTKARLPPNGPNLCNYYLGFTHEGRTPLFF
jgi:hypothetical protein